LPAARAAAAASSFESSEAASPLFLIAPAAASCRTASLTLSAVTTIRKLTAAARSLPTHRLWREWWGA